MYPRYRIRILKKNIFVKLLLLLAYSESELRFFNYFEDFIGSIFQPRKMASYIRAARAQNAIKIFSLPNRKFHRAYSPNALNELNLALTQ